MVRTPKIFFRVCLFKLWFLLTQILRNNFRFDEKIGSLNVRPPWKFYSLTVRGGKMSVNFKWCHIDDKNNKNKAKKRIRWKIKGILQLSVSNEHPVREKVNYEMSLLYWYILDKLNWKMNVIMKMPVKKIWI